MLQNVPGNSTSNISGAKIRDIEDGLRVFLISIFRIDARGYRNYRQRTILVTPKSKDVIEKELDALTAEIAELEDADDPGSEFQIEVLTNQDFIEKKREQRPQDSAIISIVRPLTIAKRSPKTGRVFHDDAFEYCPETSVPLRYIVAANPEG